MTTVSDGHQVAERARKFLFEEVEGISEVLVHVDPEPDLDADPGQHLSMPRREIETLVRSIATQEEKVQAVSHLAIHYLNEHVTVQVNIALPGDMSVAEAGVVAARVRRRLEERAEIDAADIHLELDDTH